MTKSNFEFNNPEFLWLLIVIPIVGIWFYWKRNQQQASLRVSNTKGMGVNSIMSYAKLSLVVLRLVALALLIVALARPRTTSVSTKSKKNKGIDIVMAMDVSPSMLARDLKPNRLEALKEVAAEFVDKRPSDRIGVVLYAGESYTKTPITSDNAIVKRTIRSIEYGGLENGTAIGMGLGSAVNRLKESEAKSKVIILLTDGENNSGEIDPKTAAELAVGLGIKVYAIGIGSNGTAEMPVALDHRGKFIYQNKPVKIDEELLRHIAQKTGGRYFRATSNNRLEGIYEEIDQLEKTEIEEYKYYNYQELFRKFAIIAMVLLVIEFVLKQTLFRSFI